MIQKDSLKNMNNNSQEVKLQLIRWQALNRLCKSTDYQQHLKPYLQQAFSNKWIDPSQFKTLGEFHKSYTENFGKATAFQEIIDLLDSAELAEQQTQALLNKPEINGIG